jgi:hypothetical protein
MKPEIGDRAWVRIGRHRDAHLATILRVARDGSTAYVALERSIGANTPYPERYVQHRSIRADDVIELVSRGHRPGDRED